MSRARTTCLSLLLAVGAVLVMAASAQAQVVRFVSTTGDDAANCTRLTPCRTLQRGINRTPSGGELMIMNAGTYGTAATIDRSITISAVGVAASAGTVTINAPGHMVVLRGLLLTGNNAPVNVPGVAIVAAGAVHIVRCEIERFSGGAVGIRITSDNTALFISDTIVRHNGFSGLELTNLSTGVQMTIDNSRFENNGEDGIRIVSSSDTTITRVVSSANADRGIVVSNGRVNVTSTTVANNGRDGLLVGTNGQITMESSVAHGNVDAGLRVTGGVGRVGSSVFTNNGTGLQNDTGATLLSRGNNTVSGNATPTTGTITPLDGM